MALRSRKMHFPHCAYVIRFDLSTSDSKRAHTAQR